jgi:hypothetical protein
MGYGLTKYFLITTSNTFCPCPIHYLPILWSAKPPSERRRDLFVMVVIGLLAVARIVVAAFGKVK